MSTQTIQSWAVTGETLTMKAYTYNNDTVVDSASATESTNRKGLYSASFTDLPANTYVIQLETASGVVRSFYWVTTIAATGTFQSYEIPETGSSSGTVDANLIEVQGQTVTLDNLNLFVDYWNPLQGTVLQLTQGDTYQTTINTQITLTDAGFLDLSTLPNTGCELSIKDIGTGQNILEDHQSTTVDNASKTITFELTGAQTSSNDWLVHNNYKYRIAARFPTNKVVTLLRGSAIIADSLD